MGAVFGTAVGHPDHLDEAEMILSATADLRTQHLHVLRVMTGVPPSFSDDPESAPGWSEQNLTQSSGLRSEFVILAIARLSAAGLVRTLNVLVVVLTKSPISRSSTGSRGRN